uniref:(northern house mosquito) hypothetical protein n=1 Tax=Culex pipiens TaxID=7175 RepID=A0A8D8P7U6_CULPI
MGSIAKIQRHPEHGRHQLPGRQLRLGRHRPVECVRWPHRYPQLSATLLLGGVCSAFPAKRLQMYGQRVPFPGYGTLCGDGGQPGLFQQCRKGDQLVGGAARGFGGGFLQTVDRV